MFLQTPAERVKAKMKLQLSETGIATFFFPVNEHSMDYAQ